MAPVSPRDPVTLLKEEVETLQKVGKVTSKQKYSFILSFVNEIQ